MNKIKQTLKQITIWFFFGMVGFTTILMLTGAFRFAVAFIENETPGFIEWLGMIFVVLFTGIAGLVWFVCDSED